MADHLTLGDRLRALAASSHAECLPFVDREDIERAAGAVDATEGVSDEELNHLTSQGGLAIMLVALGQAERQFRWYGDLHAEKPDPMKAARNYEYADMLRALLPQTGEAEPTPAPVSDTDRVIADIAAERRRQVDKEGYTSEHDDQWSKGELARAAACYAADEHLFTDNLALHKGKYHTVYVELWPWPRPVDIRPERRRIHPLHPRQETQNRSRRDALKKVAALCAAEMERIDRADALSKREDG